MPKSHISIKRGDASRDKVLWIEGASLDEILEKLKSQEQE
jgi:uncharacterized protein YggU (UPF0235/DUF167 family)